MVKMRIKLLCRRGIHSNSSIKHSISRIKSAFSREELDNAVPSSNTWWLRRSYAALSVASDIPDPEKDRKSVPIEARRAMVESFVDKHKALNAGKFPSISNTQKEVGGSFYVVRKILQELQNESTMSSLKGRSKKSFVETAIKDHGSLTEENPKVGGKHLEAAKKILSAAADDVELPFLVRHSALPMKSNFLEDSKEVISASRLKPDDNVKDLDISEHVCTESHVLKNEQDVVSDVHLESISSSEELKHEGQNCKEQQVHSSAPELDRENIKNREVDEARVPTSESKSWGGGHLQSIVDGIISLWRKL